MKEKLYAIRQLRKSKAFVLSTDQETMMYIGLNEFDTALQLVALKEVYRNLGDSIKHLEKGLDGRNN